MDNFVCHFDLETTILACYPSKNLNYTAIIWFLPKLSTLTILKFTISTRTDIRLQTSVEYLRAITMCCAFTPNCGYDNCTIILIGDVYCPNAKSLGKLSLHKKIFQSLGRSNYQNPQCGSVCQVRNNPFGDQTNSSFVAWLRGLHFWSESKISSRCYYRCVLSCQILFQQTEMRIYWKLCNNSEIHLWLRKDWSLVVCSQSSFYDTGARKDDKNRQNTFFSAKKKMNLVPNKQLLPNVPFPSSKYTEKDFCGNNKKTRVCWICVFSHM